MEHVITPTERIQRIIELYAEDHELFSVWFKPHIIKRVEKRFLVLFPTRLISQ